MLAYLLIGLGLSGNALKLLVIFLSVSQKKALYDATVALWNRLDELKRLSLVGWVRDSAYFPVFVIVVLGLFGAYSAARGRRGTEIESVWAQAERVIAGFVAFSLVGLVFGKLFIGWIRRSKSIRQIVLMLLVASVPVALGTLVLVLTPEHTVVPIIAVGVLSVGAFGIFLCLIVLAPIIIAYIASALLCTSEWIMRRIAESPDGPLLTASTLILGIGAIVKVME